MKKVDGKFYLRPIVLDGKTIKALLKAAKGTETQEFVTTVKFKDGAVEKDIGSWSWGFTAEIAGDGSSSVKVLPLKWTKGK